MIDPTRGTLSRDNRVPVTLVAGWLGAGKSALARRLASDGAAWVGSWGWEGPGARDDTASGELAIEEEVAERRAGCACCAVRWDLVRSLPSLALRSPAPSRILVEVGALSDVALAGGTMLRERRLRHRVRLDGAIALVDGPAVACRLAAGQDPWPHPRAWDHLAFADSILVGRACRLSTAAVDEVLEVVAQVNPLAEVRIDSGDGAPELPTGGFGAAGVAKVEAIEVPRPPSRAREGGVAMVDVVDVAGELEWDDLVGWLNRVHRETGGELLRARGVVAVRGDDRRRLVSGVRTMLDQWAGRPWAGASRGSRLVLAGRDLPVEVLQDALAAVSRT